MPGAVYLLLPAGDAFLELTPFMQLGEDGQRLHVGRAATAGLDSLVLRDDARGREIERGAGGAGEDHEPFASWLSRRATLLLLQAAGDRLGTLARRPRLELAPGGLVAGRYEVRCLLGEGGTSRVYRVWDRLAEEEVALKMLRPGVARDPSLRERFRREAGTMSRVNHPHIVRVRSSGDLEDGTPSCATAQPSADRPGWRVSAPSGSADRMPLWYPEWHS